MAIVNMRLSYFLFWIAYQLNILDCFGNVISLRKRKDYCVDKIKPVSGETGLSTSSFISNFNELNYFTRIGPIKVISYSKDK